MKYQNNTRKSIATGVNKRLCFLAVLLLCFLRGFLEASHQTSGQSWHPDLETVNTLVSETLQVIRSGNKGKDVFRVSPRKAKSSQI